MRAVLAFLAGWPLAAAVPENVLLVVNTRSAESREIGTYYAARRSIPAFNVCRIESVTDETIERPVYDREVRDPVAACLRRGGLAESVLYIVTTLGVPLRVNGEGGQQGTHASVDSELTLLYSFLKGEKPKLAGPSPNPFFGMRDAPFRHPAFAMYLVTRLAAYSVATVKAMIDRSLGARDEGNFVIDLPSGGQENGNSWLRNSALLLPARRVVLDESARVLGKQERVIAYASWGSNDGSRKQRLLGFQWLPGAIATEFVSSNGRTFARPPANWNLGVWEDNKSYFGGSPQSLSADYLEEGATGVSGHVFEPYLTFAPRPDYVLPAYAAGRNLAESFYLAIPALSWQNIVLGDPLCSLRNPPAR